MLNYCNKCVMPSTKPDLYIDSEGVCNACKSYEQRVEVDWNIRYEELKTILEKYRNKDSSNWDCVVPVSGGKDSTYQVTEMLKLGLNPLCVHFDNGWNSEVSVQNIHKIIEKTGFDLETYVIDWLDFKDLQRSFFKSGVKDIPSRNSSGNFIENYDSWEGYGMISFGTQFNKKIYLI